MARTDLMPHSIILVEWITLHRHYIASIFPTYMFFTSQFFGSCHLIVNVLLVLWSLVSPYLVNTSPQPSIISDSLSVYPSNQYNSPKLLE